MKEYPDCSYKPDCVSCDSGKCLILYNTEFKGRLMCPFYMNKAMKKEITAQCKKRNKALGIDRKYVNIY